MAIDIRTFLTEEEKKRIDEAVEKAEMTTSGEIVPVLAGFSGNYDRGLFLAAMVGAGLATLILVGIYLLPLPFLDAEPWAIPLWVVLPCQFIGLALGYRAAATNEKILRRFVPREILQQSVAKAAYRLFSTLGIQETRDSTGILIYVSLFERLVFIVADRSISNKLSEETWKDMRDGLVTNLKIGKAADGFIEAIQKCGHLLSSHFPRKPDDSNELPNQLRVIPLA